MSYELNTSIANLRDLRESDLSSYDGVYLGDIYCRLYERNFLEHPTDLREGLRVLADQGKRAYVTTYAAPRNDFLPKIRKTLETAATAGAQAVEVHNLGVLKIAHDEFPGLPVHVGGFANIYTDAGVEVLRGFGAVRFAPNYELSLDEILEIVTACRVPAELLIHGKMPLGVSDYCFLLDYEERWGMKCPDLCQKDLFLRRGDWAMKSLGKGILSGKDVCMLEHLPRLLRDGHRLLPDRDPVGESGLPPRGGGGVPRGAGSGGGRGARAARGLVERGARPCAHRIVQRLLLREERDGVRRDPP